MGRGEGMLVLVGRLGGEGVLRVRVRVRGLGVVLVVELGERIPPEVADEDEVVMVC